MKEELELNGLSILAETKYFIKGHRVKSLIETGQTVSTIYLDTYEMRAKDTNYHDKMNPLKKF